jgi:Arc/MetJ family transcription regulator
MLLCIIFDDKVTKKLRMRTTVSIDDELYQRALDVADPGMDKADLFREAIKVFVRVQAGKRLGALGGKAPGMKGVPRRRPAEVPHR